MAIIGNGVARASTLLAAAGNLTSSSQETTTYPKPHTLWLQNIAIALEVIMPAISLIVCSLRAYIRFSTKYLGWDDFWIFSAMFLCMPQAATAVQYIKEGYIGIHNREIPPHDPTEANILNFINGLLYNPILSMVKISVLTFLLRLASTKPAVRVTVWILMIFTACMMIVIFFCVIFVCHPIAANWDKTIKAHCFNRNTFSMWTASVNLLTDFLTLAIPFWIFLGLRMARKVKIALLCVFAMGFSVSVVGGVRLYFLYKHNFVRQGPDSNFSIGFTTQAMETNLAIISASGPALWPLARRWFPKFFKNLGLSRGYQGDLPDIAALEAAAAAAAAEAAGEGHAPLAKTTSGASSKTSRRPLSYIFGSAASRSGGRRRSRSTTGGGGGSRAKDGASEWFAAVYATHTIGGTELALKDLPGGGSGGGGAGSNEKKGAKVETGEGLSAVRSHTPRESEEEIMTYDGVVRAAEYGRRSRQAYSPDSERYWFDEFDETGSLRLEKGPKI